METLNPPTTKSEFNNLETLNPPTTKSPIFSSHKPRRIHLDSSSYRSLARILSHCINHSLLPLSPPPATTLAAEDPISILGDFDEKEIEASVSTEDLRNVMLECGRLIDAPYEEPDALAIAGALVGGDVVEEKRDCGKKETGLEEGEISDDAQDLEALVDVDDSERVLEDRKKEGPSRDEFKEVASTALGIHKKELTDLGVNPFDTSEDDSTEKANQNKHKVVEDRKNKKRSTLTEERKAKKKIAKKRKRAQKNREQGVKKLKLHSIVKPKEVKFCNFYQMGRCQQGNLCKYSHDTTPLTKSMPCKYFACNSCLKGDDCPYDHELSKYPCLNHMSTGSCHRGDGCKFSHKIPTTDAACQLTVSKIDLHLTSKQPKLRNQSIGVHASPLDTSSFEGKTKEALPLLKANRVPKGIRLISFETGKTDLTNKAKESLPVNKPDHTGAYNYQKQNDLLVHGHQSALTLAWNSLHPQKSMKSSGLVGDVSSNGFPVKDSVNVTKGSPVAHPGGTSNHEVSEASKILEEFLFCGSG